MDPVTAIEEPIAVSELPGMTAVLVTEGAVVGTLGLI